MTLTCRVLKLCRAQYYRWLAEPVTEAEKVRNRRVAALWAAHADDPQAGYRYLRDAAEEAGVVMSERTAWRLLDTHTWVNREELTIAIITWIEHRYHRQRRQQRLGRLTPIEYEIINAKAAIQAA